MSNLENQYQKMIETLENTIKDKKALEEAKKELDDIVSIVAYDANNILDKYDEKLQIIEQKNIEYEERISSLEERLHDFEKMMEIEDYDFFITCPYCGFEFQTDYDEEIEEVCCPECGEVFEIDWEDDDDSNSSQNEK